MQGNHQGPKGGWSVSTAASMLPSLVLQHDGQKTGDANNAVPVRRRSWKEPPLPKGSLSNQHAGRHTVGAGKKRYIEKKNAEGKSVREMMRMTQRRSRRRSAGPGIKIYQSRAGIPTPTLDEVVWSPGFFFCVRTFSSFVSFLDWFGPTDKVTGRRGRRAWEARSRGRSQSGRAVQDT